jgi:predicted 2-oxoglutarate/Fe(II)-dependent dioxygenase YbiX
MELDPEAFDFIYEPNFLTPAECALLAETANALAGGQHVEGIEDDFWKGRILFFRDVLAGRPGAAALMRDAQRRVTERLRNFYELTVPVFADTVQLVRWRTGMHMPAHADRAHADGAPHDMAFRDFASVVYLNDDYDGGELYFPRLDLTVKPAAGMLLAFTGGWYHEHGVLKVAMGERLTMPAFYTFDASRRERELYGLARQAE